VVSPEGSPDRGDGRDVYALEAKTQTPTLSTIGMEGETYIATVPPSRRGSMRPSSTVRASQDGWVDLTRFVDRSSDDAVITAMETSLAFQKYGVMLSYNDLYAKLKKLTKQKPDVYGVRVPDMMYVIDHLGVQAVDSAKFYTARSFRLPGVALVVSRVGVDRVHDCSCSPAMDCRR
jgi:hypothetical protein